jgi:hypothetical protein
VRASWRAELADPSLWTVLDLTSAAGAWRVPRRDAALRGAAAHAAGTLQSLSLDAGVRVEEALLLDVLRANARALTTLHVHAMGALSCDDVARCMRLAPALTCITARVAGASAADAARMLRNTAGPLQLFELEVVCSSRAAGGGDEGDDATMTMRDADFASLLRDAEAHPTLRGLALVRAPLHTRRALEALVAVALRRRFTRLQLTECGVGASSAPALRRLVGSGGALRTLRVHNMHTAPTAADARELGSVFGALMSADAAAPSSSSSSLTTLDVAHCGLGDAGLTPLARALRRSSSSLRRLACHHNQAGARFARHVLLPAVRRNTSLRVLTAAGCVGPRCGAYLRHAQALVAARRRAQRRAKQQLLAQA